MEDYNIYLVIFSMRIEIYLWYRISRSTRMAAGELLLAVVTIGVIAYLTYVMLYPTRF
ncbi:potassium-transporting ATPase subunit F [Natronoglomus mannanivorans]|uniref:potassium-transporting ATPase subunit F n=1 Tax=Natronoglomus mannanivorans TaxID=2979990 RepID=UPI003CCD008F